MTKKVFIVFALFLLISPVYLHTLWLHYVKIEVKHQVKENIKSGLKSIDLKILVFSKEEAASLKWEHSREFEYLGEMYDVIEKYETSDSISYTVWPDKKETKINRLISRAFRRGLQNDAQKSETQKRFFNLFQLLYFQTHEANTLFFAESESLLNPFYSPNYHCPKSAPLVPPPQKLV